MMVVRPILRVSWIRLVKEKVLKHPDSEILRKGYKDHYEIEVRIESELRNIKTHNII